MGAVITRIKAKMRKISGLNMGRRGTKLPCCSRAPQDPHSSWGHKSHWKTSSSHNGNAQRGRGRHRVLMGLGLGWEVPLLCTALPFPATPPAPALAAVPAPSTARLPRPRWHWAFLALLPLGPFRLPPTTGIWEASGSGEGSAAAVPSEGGPGHESPHPQAALHLHGGLGHLHPPPPLSPAHRLRGLLPLHEDLPGGRCARGALPAPLHFLQAEDLPGLPRDPAPEPRCVAAQHPR